MIIPEQTTTPPHLLRRNEITATPSTYLEYSFELPKQRYVGLLACQRDPLLTTLITEVVRCDKYQPPPSVAKLTSKGNKGATRQSASVDSAVDLWEIELMDTVLFPEGGGQPSDTGVLIPLNSEPSDFKENDEAVPDPIRVREVVRRHLDAVHFANAPLSVGQSVLVKLDKDQRRDKMCQHTGQHLMSAMFDTIGLETVSWALTPQPQPCYVELLRSPTKDEIILIQDKCNQAIAEGKPLKVRLEKMGKSTGADHAAVEAHEKMPLNYIDDKGDRPSILRTVEIENLDKNPCCGTHYPSLSYLQSLFILPQTSTIRGSHSRVYFLVGPRVLSHLSLTHHVARASATELGCPLSDLSDRVAKLQTTNKDTLRREKKLKDALAEYIATGLVQEASQKHSKGYGVYFREDDSTNSLDLLSTIAIILKDKVDGPELRGLPHLFCLACGPSPASSSDASATRSLVVVGSTDDLVSKLGRSIGDEFEGRIRGGGKGRWQGKLKEGEKWGKNDKQKLKDMAARCMTE